MADAHGAGQFREALIFLTMAGVIVPVFHGLKVSPVIGFLIGGVLVGPFGLGALASHVPLLKAVSINDVAGIAPLAELGVVFLLFTIGLELSFERLKSMRRLIFGLGTTQLLASALILAGAGLLLGLSAAGAAILGAALALSSTAIVLPVLAERRRLASAAGRASFSILILQDLAVAPLLIAISALAGNQQGSSLVGFVSAFAWGMLVIAILVIAGRLLLRPLMQLVARAGSQELFLAASILIALGAGLIAAAAGHSMALGAFLAGLLLAETEYRHEIEVTIGPFKGLLLGLFFMTAGAQLDLGRLAAEPGFILTLAAGLVIVKAAILFAAVRLFQLPEPAQAEIALPLAPGGEFAFVLIGAGMAAGLVPVGIGSAWLVAVLLTMFAVPLLHRLGLGIGLRRRIAALPAEAQVADPAPMDGRVIVVGFGRVGHVVGDMLGRHKVPYLAVDVDPEAVAAARREGLHVLYGDASRPEFLRRIGIEQARALVATSGDPDAIERLVRTARAARPDLIIIARARDAAHAATLYKLGATDVVPETVEASLQLAENVLVDIGEPMGLVIASVHERRDEFRALLQRGGAPARPGRQTRRPSLRRDAPEPSGEADDASGTG